MYQTCTEFGFFQTSDSDKQPFGNLFPLKYESSSWIILNTYFLSLFIITAPYSASLYCSLQSVWMHSHQREISYCNRDMKQGTESWLYSLNISFLKLFSNELNMLFFRYSIQQCMDIFGSTFNATNIQLGVTQTNTNYGGYGIASSKVSACAI